MKLKNAKPGVEVIDKELGTTCTIRGVNDGLVYIEESAFAIYLRRFRLANKPKRSELVKRVEELEKRELAYETQIHLDEEVITSLKTGTYFADRPYREKWQHVANLTGWTIKSIDNVTLILYEGDNQEGVLINGTWTDEPLEKRIVGPIQPREEGGK